MDQIELVLKSKLFYLHNNVNPFKFQYWDDELAEVAQHHASRCSFPHDETHNRNLPGINFKYTAKCFFML